MLDAVGYVHEQKLVHRDIKPSNFMIDKKGKVKLMDFGIAKTLDSSAADYTTTHTGMQMGTPMYMSPEQITETKSVTAQSDIYSLGVVLWQMVTGKKPYDMKTLSNFQLQLKIVQEPLEVTHTDWDRFIQKATAKDALNRYKSSSELKQEVLSPPIFRVEESESTQIENEKTIVIKEISSIENQKISINSNSKLSDGKGLDFKSPNPNYKKNSTTYITIAVGIIFLLIILFAVGKYNDSTDFESTTVNTYLFRGDSTIVPAPIKIEIPNFNGYHTTTESANLISLSQISSIKNEIIDTENWFNENNLRLPTYTVYNEFRNEKGNVPENVPKSINGLRITDGFNYDNADIYFYGENFGEKNLVIITDEEKNGIKHSLDFSNFTYSSKTAKGDEDYVYQSVNWAIVENDILYISHGHFTYASSSFGQNAYISAIDLKDYKIIWTTQPLTCNSTFTLIGNAIVCGYGFTDEPDYLYVIDKLNGVKVQQIGLNSGPEYIIQQNNKLFVRTYNNNYVFSIN
jgi:serine/threonine protein kinase